MQREKGKTRKALPGTKELRSCSYPPQRAFEENLEDFLGDGSSLKMLFFLQFLYLCVSGFLHARYTGSKASAGVFLIASCRLLSITPLSHTLTLASYSPTSNVYFSSPLGPPDPENFTFVPVCHLLMAAFFFLVQSRAHILKYFRCYFVPFSALTLPNAGLLQPSEFPAFTLTAFDCTILNRTLGG